MTTGELFAYLTVRRTTMPPTAPGSLSDQKYADAMATLFNCNGFPATEDTELPADRQIPTAVVTREKP